jgi:predicted amidohydrolase
MKELIKIGMGQMFVDPGKPYENLLKAQQMIKQAASKGCNMIVLPECLDLGWTYSRAHSLAEPIPGQYSDELVKAASSSKIYISAGLTEKSGNKLYNSAVLISPDGEIILKHRKINEVPFARELYSVGDSLGVTSTKLGTIGMNICADNVPDSLFLGHSLGIMGAKILVSPCAWAVRPDHDNKVDPYGSLWKNSYSELAKQHSMPVIGVSNVGPVIGGEWDGWKCIGCSLAVDAYGEVIVQGSYGERAEELIVIDIRI